MLNFSHLAFTTPWLLGFLALLPLLWWLLRLTPPAPKKILFPALELLRGLVGREETPARSPWWLLLLRLILATLVILAFAKPVIDPRPATHDSGSLLIAIDNDWAAARDWQNTQNNIRDLLQKSAHDQRSIYLMITTTHNGNTPLAIDGPMATEAALAICDHLQPEAWPADWQQATEVLRNLKETSIHEAVWFASGIGSVDTPFFYQALQKIAPTKIIANAAPIYALTSPAIEDDALKINILRTATDKPAETALNAVGKDGQILAHWPILFTEGSPRATQTLDLPPQLRNHVARFEIDTPHTAASTVLMDAAWQHRSVGIVGDVSELDRHSLLSEIYYLDRALKPFADAHIDTLETLLKNNMPVIILTDATTLNDTTTSALTSWIKHGGVLVRFAGEHFSAAESHSADADILPVPLRSGGRSLGGALTWGTPQKLQSFPANSPFHTLSLPEDVTVSRQILAEPSPDLQSKTWAALQDGTPLVTASPLGQGVTILFHIPAKSSWSNLSISGLFVEMLQKILQLSAGDHTMQTTQSTMLPALQLLDSYGELHDPSAAILPLDSTEANSFHVTAQHPPGLYGTDTNSFALNLGNDIGQPEALHNVPTETYQTDTQPIDLQPALLVAALLLLLADFIISLRMRGFLKLASLLFGMLLLMPAAHATDDKIAVELTSKIYLAYVQTGDASIDHISELGLHGLAYTLTNRTSMDDVGVARIDPDRDDIAFFPLIYWPVATGQRPLSPEGARRVNHYLHHGGMILFDAANSGVSASLFLQRVLNGVDIPALVRLPDNHVLKRSFYLLEDLPGRFTGHDVWLEPEDTSSYDGVASVIFGSNGWAAAWAVDDAGHALYPCTPDGEAQRERAYRFGVNLVIYALTGNYKNDQLQTSALLERMKK